MTETDIKTDKKPPFSIDLELEEEKHKETLNHYLEKIHDSTKYQNKDVAEILDLDKGTYSKIRQGQIAPLTNSIITLKKYAYLNDMNILDFIAHIEKIPVEIKDNDWLSTLSDIMLELGDIVRRELIHKRISEFLKHDPEYLEKFRKCFVLLTLLIDVTKDNMWFDFCSNMIIKIHGNIGCIKSKNLEALISRIKIQGNK